MEKWRELFAYWGTGILSILMWVHWSTFTGVPDPWTPGSPGIYYFAVVFLIGWVGGFVEQRQWWVSYIGLVLGQLLYGFYVYWFNIPHGEGLALIATRKIRISLMIIVFMSLPGLVAAYLGALVARWRQRGGPDGMKRNPR